MTKPKLIQFINELVELASEENKTKAVLVKKQFLSDFEKSYGYEKEAILEELQGLTAKREAGVQNGN